MGDVAQTRRKKTASERRQQRDRAHSRALQMVLKSVVAIDARRGSALTAVGKLLQGSLLCWANAPAASCVPLPVWLRGGGFFREKSSRHRV